MRACFYFAVQLHSSGLLIPNFLRVYGLRSRLRVPVVGTIFCYRVRTHCVYFYRFAFVTTVAVPGFAFVRFLGLPTVTARFVAFARSGWFFTPRLRVVAVRVAFCVWLRVFGCPRFVVADGG